MLQKHSKSLSLLYSRFSVEPTDEAAKLRGDRQPWFRGLLGMKKDPDRKSESFMRKMGLEPTRPCGHKILSLARLPVPTLPRTFGSISEVFMRVKHKFEKNQKPKSSRAV